MKTLSILTFISCILIGTNIIGQQTVKDVNGFTQKSFTSNVDFTPPDQSKAGEIWKTIGPFGGDVLDIAVNPMEVMSVFAAAGAPYISNDGGQTWQILEALKNLAGGPINTVEATSNGVIYASGPYSYAKIFRSMDGGVTWQQKPIPLNSSVLDITIDPSDPNTIYAGLTSVLGSSFNNVVIKSTDQGDSWTYFNMTSVLPVGYSVVNLAVDPDNNQTIFVIGNEGISNAKVAATFDGGTTWENKTGNLPTGKPLNKLAIAGQKVFIAGGQLFGSQVVGVYKTENFGQSWENISTTFPNKVTNDILVDPTESNKMYAASEGDGIYYTLDGGLNWNFDAQGAGATGAARCLIFEPGNTDVIIAGFLSLGVCKSTDAALNWQLSNKGIATLLTNDIETNPNNPMQILVGFEAENSGGCYLTNDGGETWQLMTGLPGTRYSQVTIGADEALYAWSNGPSSIGQEGLYKSTDNGNTWENKGPNIGGLFETQIFGLMASSIDPSLLFIGGNNFGVNGWASVVYRSTNGGDDWDNVYVGPDNDSFKFVFIAPDSNDETIYASYGNQSDHAGFIKSVDGGLVWADMNNGIPSANKYSGAIVCESGNPNVLYGGVGGYGDLGATVFKSLDGGTSWNATSLSLGTYSHINDILVSPLNNDILYAASTEHGVYLSADGGTTWEAANTGLPATYITGFSRPFIVNDTTYFCASTFSGSAFKTRIFNPITSINQLLDQDNSVSILTNPSKGSCKIEMELERSSFVNLQVYNISGQQVQLIENREIEKGKYHYEIDLQPGIYFLAGKINGNLKTSKVVIL